MFDQPVLHIAYKVRSLDSHCHAIFDKITHKKLLFIRAHKLKLIQLADVMESITGSYCVDVEDSAGFRVCSDKQPVICDCVAP